MASFTDLMKSASTALKEISTNIVDSVENIAQKVEHKTRDGTLTLNDMFSNHERHKDHVTQLKTCRERYIADTQVPCPLKFQNIDKRCTRKIKSSENYLDQSRDQLQKDLKVHLRRNSEHTINKNVVVSTAAEMEFAEPRTVVKTASVLQSLETGRTLLDQLLNQQPNPKQAVSVVKKLKTEKSSLDSITDVILDENRIQVTINHEMKRNILTLTLHRLRVPIESWVKTNKIFVITRLLPGKAQKQRSKNVDHIEAQRWEEDFLFRKMTIGELEEGSIEIKVYSQRKFPKFSVFIGKATISLDSVNLNDFSTTTVNIDKELP